MHCSPRTNQLPNLTKAELLGAFDMTIYQHRLKLLYEHVASHYPTVIVPVMSQMTGYLFDLVRLEPGQRVLDIGTGAGSIANRAAEYGCRTIGIDISEPMLAIARCNRLTTTLFAAADVHKLPFDTTSFDVVLAGFCLNETDPQAALAEIRRVLKPGGQFGILEWGPVDPLNALVDSVLAEYATKEAAGFQAVMRELTSHPRLWDEEVFSCREIVNLIEAAGFAAAECEATIAEIEFHTPEAFVEYALVWPPRRTEVEAMSAQARTRFYRQLYTNLGTQGPIWGPTILRATAIRSAD